MWCVSLLFLLLFTWGGSEVEASREMSCTHGEEEGLAKTGRQYCVDVPDTRGGIVLGGEEVAMDTTGAWQKFMLSSSWQGTIPCTYGCDCDKNWRKPSPSLDWQGPPGNTTSYVLVMDDVSPTGRGFVNWLVVNIPPNEASIPDGASGDVNAMPPSSLELMNSYGDIGYGGPCPPRGDRHTYRIRVFARPCAITTFDYLGNDYYVKPVFSDIELALRDSIGVAVLEGSFHCNCNCNTKE